jgi:hypothetical protein
MVTENSQKIKTLEMQINAVDMSDRLIVQKLDL